MSTALLLPVAAVVAAILARRRVFASASPAITVHQFNPRTFAHTLKSHFPIWCHPVLIPARYTLQHTYIRIPLHDAPIYLLAHADRAVIVGVALWMRSRIECCIVLVQEFIFISADFLNYFPLIV